MTTFKVLEHNNQTVERWTPPQVSGKVVTAEQLGTIQQQAYDEGFKRGQKEGALHKKQEVEKNIATLSSMIEVLSEPLKNLDKDIVEQLSHLSMSVAKQVIRRELHTEHGEIVGIVREAMTALPASTKKITLNIHPDDSELIKNAFSINNDDDSDELRWKVIEDPMITRGGCKIASENSRIDATIESRLNRIINTLLGDERETDE